MKRGTRGLTEEERILWHTVARTVKPRPGKALPEAEAPPPPVAAPAQSRPKADTSTVIAPFLPAYVPPVSKPKPILDLDDPTHRKIAKEKLSIEARIDLHGMTQDEAHGRLLGFLHRSHASGLRHILIITGKGRASSGDGILRRAVPQWFRTAPFRGLVGAWASAARHHGGEGALYVRLRRAGSE